MLDRCRIAVIGAAVACLAGCNMYTYDVSMVRRGEAFERTVKVTKAGGEAEAPPAGPGAQPGAAPRVGTTVTTIAGATPEDVGGAGWVGTAGTSMGTLVVYTERFRGTDDPGEKVVRLFASVDRLVDHALAWLQSQAADAPEYGRLRAFGQTDLRRDLKNLALALYFDDGSRRGTAVSDEPYARVFQYVIERGYLKPDELPALVRSASGATPEAGTNMVRLIGEPILSRAGIDPRTVSPKVRGFLDDPAKLKESFDAYLASTPAYAKLSRAAVAAGKPTPDPQDVLQAELAEAPILLRLFPDWLKLALAAPVKPLATNGTWDESAGVIRWEAALGPRENAGEYPFVAHARWVEADAAFQSKRFGRVILDGEKLEEYCVWRKGLTQTEGAAWEEALRSLTPGADVVGGMRRVTATSAIDERTAAEGIRLLTDGMKSGR